MRGRAGANDNHHIYTFKLPQTFISWPSTLICVGKTETRNGRAVQCKHSLIAKFSDFF